jgi:hypothetical protein
MAPDAENFRGIHAVGVLTPVTGLTLDKLIELAYDPYLPGFGKLIPGLIDAFDQSGQENSGIAEAVGVLRAMTLAHFYGINYYENGQTPDDMQDASFMELIDYFGTGSSHEERLRIFAETVAMLEADFGQWNTPWGEVNRYQRINGDIEQPFNDSACRGPERPPGFAAFRRPGAALRGRAVQGCRLLSRGRRAKGGADVSPRGLRAERQFRKSRLDTFSWSESNLSVCPLSATREQWYWLRHYFQSDIRDETQDCNGKFVCRYILEAHL